MFVFFSIVAQAGYPLVNNKNVTETETTDQSGNMFTENNSDMPTSLYHTHISSTEMFWDTSTYRIASLSDLWIFCKNMQKQYTLYGAPYNTLVLNKCNCYSQRLGNIDDFDMCY